VAIDLTTPIIDVDEYRSLVGRTNPAKDTEVAGLLLGMTRLIEKRARIAPGMLVPQTALTFTFDSVGGAILRLRSHGLQYYLRTTTADLLLIDDDADGVWDDYTLDFDDAWVQGEPVNAAQFLEPFTHIRLRNITGATITAWPNYEGAVKITGDWGWATTPTAIKDRVALITRELIEAHHGGPSLDIESALSPQSARQLSYVIEQEYGARIPVVA